MGIAGLWLLEKQTQLLCYGCRDSMSFLILGFALYLNPNSSDIEHAEVLIREGIAEPATLWVVM